MGLPVSVPRMQTDPGDEVTGAAVDVVEVVEDRLVDVVVTAVVVEDAEELVEGDVNVELDVLVVVVEVVVPVPTHS